MFKQGRLLLLYILLVNMLPLLLLSPLYILLLNTLPLYTLPLYTLPHYALPLYLSRHRVCSLSVLSQRVYDDYDISIYSQASIYNLCKCAMGPCARVDPLLLTMSHYKCSHHSSVLIVALWILSIWQDESGDLVV